MITVTEDGICQQFTDEDAAFLVESDLIYPCRCDEESGIFWHLNPEFLQGEGYDAEAAFNDLEREIAARKAERETTVKRPDLFGVVHDSFATEAELNGFRQSQGRLI